MRADVTAVSRSNWVTVARYPLALVVAFSVSVFTALALLSAGAPLSVMHAATGFAGVLFGSLCLGRGSRVLGSLFLLVVGLVFFYFRFIVNDPGFVPEGFSNRWARFGMLCGGGFLAVVVAVVSHLLRTERKDETQV